MPNEIIIKRLKVSSSEARRNAMEYIEKVTEYALDQMENEGVTVQPIDITAEMIVEYASRHLSVEYDELYKDYIDMMVLEGMVEIIREIQAN